MRRARLLLASCLGIALSGAFACADLLGEPVAYYGGIGGAPNVPRGLGVGEDCSVDLCRAGLDCVDDVCEPAGSLPLGSPCVIGPECEAGLACIPVPPQFVGICSPAGDGEAGDACETDLDCASGLRCDLVGLARACGPAGEGDLGAPCARQSECFQGLFCAEGECSLPEPPVGIPLWKGVECEDPDNGTVRALFHVPGAEDTPEDADFFSFPYPNDVRLGPDGHPDLEGFPTPGPELLGVDMVARYVDAIETHATGFSTNPSVIFRFSGNVDFDSLKFENGARPVVIVDTEDPASTISSIGVTWAGTAGRGNYVCHNSLAVSGGVGGTLRPGHTHVAWVTTEAREPSSDDSPGDPIERSPAFEAMLGASPPSDPALAAAYAKYAPLRDYLDEHSIDPDTILVAAVFTTEDPVEPMRDLAAAVEAADLPTVSDWVRCASGVESPCPQRDGNRGCGNGTADYDEYHALVELPIFQEGEAPYLEEGGAIQSEPVRTEEVCMSLTVPKTTMPGSGWPLVVYGHGTGGSFRSHVRDEVAGELARREFAVLGIDQVQHGPRRGDSTESPNNLFFNFVNPDAARGNPLQGAADQLALLRLASTLDVSAAESGGEDIAIDPARIVLYGHSQGSTHGSLALPLSDFPGAVLSGNGGHLASALLNKTSPENIAGVVPIALEDADSEGRLRMGTDHPALGLLQHYVDPADPINFAPLLIERPEPGQTIKHVFQTFGLSDTYSPPSTMAAFFYAMGSRADVAEPAGSFETEGPEELRTSPSTSPVSGNVIVGTEPDVERFTAVCRQYEPPKDAEGNYTSDGHYVVFDDADAVEDVAAFLEALGTGTVPTVPAP